MALSRNEIKLLKSLKEKKEREIQKLFVVEGIKLTEELFSTPSIKINTVYYTSEYTGSLPEFATCVPITNSELERISGLVTPNKILAVVHYPEKKHALTKDDNLVLVLDDIKDPGNLGTILRTADWFGIRTILASESTVDVYNSKVIQASMGAVYRVGFIQTDLTEKLMDLQKLGYKLIGADMQGDNLFSFQFPSKTALIMGSESHGISFEIQKMLDQKLTIPSYGKTESLNVGIAAGIILSHFRKN